MPTQKRRHSKSRVGSHWHSRKLRQPALSTCPQCGALRLPHTVCTGCGSYKGSTVLTEKKKEKKRA